MECRSLDTGFPLCTRSCHACDIFEREVWRLFIVPCMSKPPASPTSEHVHGPDCNHDHDHGDLDPNVFLSHQPFIRQDPKIGRNDPCSCGSGKKYKKCHGA